MINPKNYNIIEISSLIKNSNRTRAVISDDDLKMILKDPTKSNTLLNVILNSRCNFICDDDQFQYFPYPNNFWRKKKVQ